MDASDECPTEEAIKAFMEYLVEPVLPPKSSTRDTPSLSQQESVAKQVHAVVLLYNYYHRKQCPKLEVLNFACFCKLALVLMPGLLVHLKFMPTSSNVELDDLEEQLSVTEKAIMDACNISTGLDASKDVPNTEGWPISKVTVLLIDPKKENCLLLHSSITQGVWSVVEKDLDVRVHSSEDTVEATYVNKMKGVMGKPSRGESRTGEASFLKLAYSAVSEATGINQTSLLVVESHVVFSVTKEKAAAGFYIIQCTQTVQDVFKVPIKDVMDSLQGPLVQKSIGSWTVTPVVEYFHVLPYARILSDWFCSRRELSNSFQDSRLGDSSGSSPPSWKETDTTGCFKSKKVLTDAFNSSQKMEVDDSSMGSLQTEQRLENISSIIQVNHHVDNLENNTIPHSKKQKDRAGFCKARLADASKGPWKVVDDSFMSPSQNAESCQNIMSNIQVANHQEKMISSVDGELHGSARNLKVKAVNSRTRPFITNHVVGSVGSGKEICSINSSGQDSPGSHALITYQSSSPELHKLQIAVASKENILSQSALKVLMKRRDDLSLQQRNIEDEIAQCDEKIQTILTGGKDDLALKLESIIEGCNDIWVGSGRTHQLLEDQSPAQNIKRKRLSEAILNMQNPCQELDGACYRNNWVLPTYHVSFTDGGFRGDVSVKGVDFECSSRGDLCSNPHEARESAAAQVLVKLRGMAEQAQKF